MQILSFQPDIAERMLEGTEGESVNENAQFVPYGQRLLDCVA
ncbi:Uncharacterised protein [Neisseria meningitidis]|nr:Uncharacterised protein [Neisseria meningitidis]